MKPSGTVLFARATTLITLGELDRALDLLEQAIEHRTWRMQMLAVEPIFERFRSSEEHRARYHALLERLGLPLG
jgi:hypothetical protein